MTVLQVIKSALRAIGQLGPGRTPGTSETADAVFVFNRMLDSFSIERLAIYHVLRSEHTLTGAASHTIGLDPAADFNVARPVRIERAALLTGTGTEEELDLLHHEQWSAGRNGLYYDAAYPLGVLYLRPATAGTLVLYTWQQLTQVADETDDLEFPPGYAEALTYQLAIRLAPEWGRAIRPDVQELAANALGRIKSLNAPVPEMSCDPGLVGRGGFDILTGDYR